MAAKQHFCKTLIPRTIYMAAKQHFCKTLTPRTIYMAAKQRVVRFRCKQIASRFTFTHIIWFTYSEQSRAEQTPFLNLEFICDESQNHREILLLLECTAV